MQRKSFVLILILLAVVILSEISVYAQDAGQEYVKGELLVKFYKP